MYAIVGLTQADMDDTALSISVFQEYETLGRALREYNVIVEKNDVDLALVYTAGNHILSVVTSNSADLYEYLLDFLETANDNFMEVI